MNVMVYDVAASSGGAVTVLEDYCREFVQDRKNNYFLLLSCCTIPASKNLYPIYFPWIKRSWFHRIYFDTIVAPRLIKKYKIDKLISLQNTLFFGIKIPCVLLIHNAIPFTEFKFRFIDSPRLWVGQNLIGRLCIKSARKADKVIVQTEWMKNVCAEKTGENKNKIEVVAPKNPVPCGVYKSANHGGKTHFFYPANASVFKNHQIIIDACRLLKRMNVENYEIQFTLCGNENNHIAQLKKNIEKEDLPISFIGWQNSESMWEYYCNSILLFPSYLETVGLPLLEAMSCNAPIIAANCEYAKSITSRYSNIHYFEAHESQSLANLILGLSRNSIKF